MSNIDVATKVSDASERLGVSFLTLGCAKNEVDTADMKRAVVSAGFGVVDDPGQASAVVVNTCSFIQTAIEESIDAILEAAALDNVARGDAKLIVSGCLPSRFGADLETELKEASAFVPCAGESDIADVLESLFGPQPEPDAALGAHLFDGNAAAYVKIGDGCDHFCSFCSIPYIRGRYRSFTYERIREAVARQVSYGVREITLIAQDTGRWGCDLEGDRTLAWLIDALASEFADTWFRVMYLEPEGVTDELLDVMASRPNVCRYLDIPVQHASERVLVSMRRSGDARRFLDLFAHARERIEGIAMRTTVIAGFPGETDEDFSALLDFLEQADLDYVGVFPYSREDGTRAARMEGQIDEETKLARAQEIRDLCDALAFSRVSSRIGDVMDVVVLGREEDGRVYGRAMCQAPEVDGVVYLDGGTAGDVVKARIVDTLAYEMEGEIVHG